MLDELPDSVVHILLGLGSAVGNVLACASPVAAEPCDHRQPAVSENTDNVLFLSSCENIVLRIII